MMHTVHCLFFITEHQFINLEKTMWQLMSYLVITTHFSFGGKARSLPNSITSSQAIGGGLDLNELERVVCGLYGGPITFHSEGIPVREETLFELLQEHRHCQWKSIPTVSSWHFYGQKISNIKQQNLTCQQ